MFNTPTIVIIPFLDLPVFKLRCSLIHGIISCLSPFIFYFLSALINKVSNFFAVITPAFVHVYSFAGNSRMSHICTFVKPVPASKPSTWSKVWVFIHTISFVTPISKVLTLCQNVPLFGFLLLSLTFWTPWPQFPNDPPP